MNQQYHIYDEIVGSDRRLDHVSSAHAGTMAWSLVQGEVPTSRMTLRHEEEDFPRGPVLRIFEHTTGSIIDYAGWSFHCQAGRVTYAHARTEEVVAFSEVIERVIAPWMILTRRPSVCALHGGAVVHDGTAWIFIGESGVGKSSAALGLVRRGALLLSDDMALIDLQTMSVLPGAWTLRMWGDLHVEEVLSKGVIVGTGGGKHRFVLRRDELVTRPQPLGGVIALSRDACAPSCGELRTIRGVRAMTTLLAQSFDLSHGSVSWRTRRMQSVRELTLKATVNVLTYAASPDGSPGHVQGLWEAINAGS